MKYLLIIVLLLSCSNRDADSIILRGKELFQSVNLSANKNISCVSCHPNGNVNRQSVNVGLTNGNGPTRKWDTQSLWNVKFTSPYLWGGESAAFFGGNWKNQLRETHRHVVDQIMGMPGGISESDLDALTEYVASLRSPKSPFLKSDGNMTDDQLKGKFIFENTNRANCISCHRDEWFTDNQIYPLKNLLGDTIAMIETPSLSAMWDTAPYWHNGQFKTIKDVLNGHHWIVGPNKTISPPLSSEEKEYLEAYLNAL